MKDRYTVRRYYWNGLQRFALFHGDRLVHDGYATKWAAKNDARRLKKMFG